MSANNTKKEDEEPSGRSPSPSALSTASSASPLIRANSTSSSASSSSQRSRGGGASSPHQQQQPRRPAPTSIAAAQLQQQLAKQQQQQGNKLAHMTPASQKQQQVNHRLQAAGEHKCKQESKLDGAHSAKGLGYNLGKMIAYRASRFNEFWSVNKMRYMNLACLLMTLVCLLTILLFSKSNVSESELEKLAQPRWSSSPKSAGANRRRHDGHVPSIADQEPPSVESMEALDRQSLVMGGSRRRSPADLLADAAALDESKHESGDPFDELLQDARRQLKRQQELEREAEESSFSSGSTANSSETKPTDEGKKLTSGQPEANLGQLFEDLDNFGLFKVIKSQLLSANLSQARPTIVRKSPHGATIIMSFGGSGNSSAISSSNGTSNPMASLLEKLMPPMFRPPSSLMLDDNPRAGSAPRGFATITIRSEPLIRAPHLPPGFSASPFAAFSTRQPSESLVSPFVLSGNPMAPPGGLFGALLRATSELVADQMGQLEAANKTNETGNFTGKDALSQQASHKQATVVRLPPAAGANSTGSGPTEGSLDEEVETFDVGQLMGSRMAPPPLPFMRSPFSPLLRSLYAAGPRNRPASIVINSRSAALPDLMFEPPSLGADFGSDSAPSPFGVLPATPFGPSLMMPHMIMLGSSGAQSGPPPMLRALLAASKQLEQRDNKEASPNSARRDDQDQDTTDSDGWDEQLAGGKLAPRHRAGSEPNEDEGAEQSAFLSSVSTGASSLIENMLESTNGSPPVGRVSGTIKQIFRGPGMTVERIIELPSSAQQLRQARRSGDDRPEVKAVAPGLRSQSISRLDEDSAGEYHKTAGSQRVPTFASQLQERSDSADLERELVRPLGVSPFASMSRPPVGGFISRLFSDMHRHHQESGESFEGPLPSLHPLGSFLSGAGSIFGPAPTSGKSQRQQRAFSERSMEDEAEGESGAPEPDEQQEAAEASQPVWSPKIRLGSARLRVSPLKHEQPLPARFAIPAEPPTRQEVARIESRAEQQDNSRMQRAMKPAPIRSINEHQEAEQKPPSSAFTSPNSALFGFPAMKAAVPALGSNKLQARASDTSTRPFVYHSNHEQAGSLGRSSESSRQQQPAPAESRSSYLHRASTGAHSVAGVPAAIGMGRRLDEGELIS